MSGLSTSAWFTGDDGPESHRPRSDGADMTIAERFGGSETPPAESCECGQAHTAAPNRTLPVTPAERAAVSMLRAWRDWTPDMADHGPVHNMLVMFGTAAVAAGLVDAETDDLTPAGRDILAHVDASDRTTATVLRAKRDAWKALAIARGAILATQHATATPEIKPHLDAAYDALASFGVVPGDTYRPNAPPTEDP